MRSHPRFILIAVGALAATLAASPALAGDPAGRGAAVEQIETGARKTQDGLGETARGIGSAVVDGTRVAGTTLADAARSTGQGIGEAGKAEGRVVRTAWEKVWDGAVDVADQIVDFLKKPF